MVVVESGIYTDPTRWEKRAPQGVKLREQPLKRSNYAEYVARVARRVADGIVQTGYCQPSLSLEASPRLGVQVDDHGAAPQPWIGSLSVT
jgi:hypothetical protein